MHLGRVYCGYRSAYARIGVYVSVQDNMQVNMQDKHLLVLARSCPKVKPAASSNNNTVHYRNNISADPSLRYTKTVHATGYILSPVESISQSARFFVFGKQKKVKTEIRKNLKCRFRICTFAWELTDQILQFRQKQMRQLNKLDKTLRS